MTNCLENNEILEKKIQNDLNTLRRKSVELVKLTDKRPNYKRQIAIRRQIQICGDGDAVSKALIMEWWEMLELQKEIIEHLILKPEDFRTQYYYSVLKRRLINRKNESLKEKYSEVKKEILRKWANNYIKMKNVDQGAGLHTRSISHFPSL